jgi:iron complex transport system ATP-binding protein
MVNVRDISFKYKQKANYILEKISLDIAANECIAILGNNGAGKSTLLKCMDRICQPQEGVVLVNNKNILKMKGHEIAKNIAYVSQNSKFLHMTVFDVILLGRKPYIEWDATKKDKAIVCQIIQKMHLEDYTMRQVSELSGGELQKVMIARALAQEPKLLLLDEPTSNLDPYNQHEVIRTVKQIAKEHHTCAAIIFHDLNLAIRYCDRFVFLKDSSLFSYGGLDTVTPELIEEVYGIPVDIISHQNTPVIIPYPNDLTKV